MDRELNQVNVACSEFTSALEEGEVAMEDVVGLLDSVDQKVSSLKSKVRKARLGSLAIPHLPSPCVYRLKNVWRMRLSVLSSARLG